MRFQSAENIAPYQFSESEERGLSRQSLVLLFVFAFGFRLIYILQSIDNPLFGVPIVDAHVYAEWAKRMAQGTWLWDYVGNYLPIYPAFLALQQILFGSSPFVNKIIQSLMGSLSAVMLAQIAAYLWNRNVGRLAGYLVATYWMLVVFESEKYAESFSIFFQSLTLWLLICHARRLWAVAAAGFAFALAAGARANLFLALPLILAWLIWTGRRGGESPSVSRRPVMARGIAAAALFSLGTLVLIGPIIVQNYRVSGAPMLRAQGTWSLYAGIAPEFEGLHPPTGILFDKYMHMPYRAGLRTEPEIERYWGEKIREVLKADPLGVAASLLRHLAVFFNAREWSQEFDVYAYRKYSGFLSLPWPGFWLVGPLGLLGFCLLRHVSREQWLLIGYTLVGFLSIVPFKASDRYRLPTAVLLTLFAALAIRQLYKIYQASDRKNLTRWLALLGLFCVLCWPDWQNLVGRKTARHDFYVGLHDESNRRFDEALARYKTSMEQFDWDPDSPYRIGHILFNRGDSGQALVYLKEALRREPLFPKALNAVARIYLKADLFGSAEDKLQESLALNPLEKDTLLLLADIRRRQGDVAAELEYLRKAAFEVRNAESTLILAERLIELGFYEDAVRAYAHVMGARQVERYLRVQAAMKAGYTAARYLKNKQPADLYWHAVSADYRDFRFFALQADYLGGALEEAEFLQAMDGDSRWQAAAIYAVGLKRWLAGDIEAAAAAFRRCLAVTGSLEEKPEQIPQKWAWEDLKRMEKAN